MPLIAPKTFHFWDKIEHLLLKDIFKSLEFGREDGSDQVDKLFGDGNAEDRVDLFEEGLNFRVASGGVSKQALGLFVEQLISGDDDVEEQVLLFTLRVV
jgi:hypothetical protein